MRDRQDQSDLLAAQLATGGAGLAFLLAAIGFLFVNYGIAIGIFAGAILLFVAAQNFEALTTFQFRRPFLWGGDTQRTHWEVFRLSTYRSIAVSTILSIVLGGVFYIVELKQQLNVATNEADRFREQLSQLTANRWEPLRQNEIVSLRALIRPMAPQPFSVACNFDSCNELGQSIYDVFHDLKWPGTYHMALYQMNSDYIYIQPMTQRQQSLVQLKVPQKVG